MHFHPPVSNGGESHEKYGSRHPALLDRKSGVPGVTVGRGVPAEQRSKNDYR